MHAMGQAIARSTNVDISRSQRKHSKTTKRSYSCTLCFATVIVLIVVLISLSLASLLYLTNKVDPRNQPSKQLGFVNTTVIVGTYSSFWYSKLSVSECLQSRDYSHVNRIALLQKETEIVRVADLILKRKLFHRKYPSSTTALIDYLYLLKGSSIHHNLCIASTSDSSIKGTVFIFDDELKYLQYAVNSDTGAQLAVYTRSVDIGVENKTVCTDITFNVDKTAYYFVAARTPAGIIYSYETHVHRLYLSKNDLDFRSCIASEPAVCDVHLSGNLFAPKEYDLIAYIEPPIAADPLSTHLCVEPHVSPAVVALTGVLGGIVGISAVLMSVICVCSVIHCHRKRSHHGYTRITNIQGGC